VGRPETALGTATTPATGHAPCASRAAEFSRWNQCGTYPCERACDPAPEAALAAAFQTGLVVTSVPKVTLRKVGYFKALSYFLIVNHWNIVKLKLFQGVRPGRKTFRLLHRPVRADNSPSAFAFTPK
jgi:hypothetical protein